MRTSRVTISLWDIVREAPILATGTLDNHASSEATPHDSDPDTRPAGDSDDVDDDDVDDMKPLARLSPLTAPRPSQQHVTSSEL